MGRFRATSTLEKHSLTTITHLQHKLQSKGENGAKAKGSLKNSQSKKFVKFIYCVLDVMKMLSDLSKCFQKDEFYITDALVHLGAATSQVDVLRHQRGSRHRRV